MRSRATRMISPVLLSATASTLGGCFGDDPLTSACETRIVERLKSPGSYQRVRIERTARDLMRGEYLSRIFTETKNSDFNAYAKNQMKMFDEGKIRAEFIEVEIEYDAKNAFGTLLRLKTTCRAFIEGGNTSQIRPWMLELSGD